LNLDRLVMFQKLLVQIFQLVRV